MITPDYILTLKKLCAISFIATALAIRFRKIELKDLDLNLLDLMVIVAASFSWSAIFL